MTDYPGAQAKVIADSVSPAGHRLTSIQVTLWRPILAEINTHRVLSRNYRSSRAVPTKTLLQEVRNAPAMPIVWMKNCAGMKAMEPMTEEEARIEERCWYRAATSAAREAERAMQRGLHKQWANRHIEPYLWCHGIITATEWDNFFALRGHPDAQPEFEALATAMWRARQASTPQLLNPRQWHLPYIDDHDVECFASDDAEWEEALPTVRKVSVARCARVTHKVFNTDRRSLPEEDIALHDRLVVQGHWSPLEHICQPDVLLADGTWAEPHLHGNFRGWCQYRRIFDEGRAP